MFKDKNTIDVSVIIPFYNSEKTLLRTLASICEQSTLPREVIIVDDFSVNPDELKKIVELYSKNINIKCKYLTENSGAANARNIGIGMASSSYIAFLDSDDVWHPQKLEVQYSFMLDSGAHLSGHEYVQDLNNSKMYPKEKLRAREIKKVNFIFGNPFFTPTVMIKRDMFLFHKEYRVVDDYCCWLENIKNGSSFMIESQLAGGFKAAIGAGGLTSNIKYMHEAYQSVLYDLYIKNEVGLFFYFFAVCIEKIKYPLRIVKCSLKK